jgi:hypothetical protein
MAARSTSLPDVFGWGLITVVWLTCAYLVLHCAADVLVGPERLVHILGESTHNALIPVGGFPLLFLIAIGVAARMVSQEGGAGLAVRTAAATASQLSSPENGVYPRTIGLLC